MLISLYRMLLAEFTSDLQVLALSHKRIFCKGEDTWFVARAWFASLIKKTNTGEPDAVMHAAVQRECSWHAGQFYLRLYVYWLCCSRVIGRKWPLATQLSRTALIISHSSMQVRPRCWDIFRMQVIICPSNLGDATLWRLVLVGGAMVYGRRPRF